MKHCAHASKPLGPFVVLCTNVEANKFFGQRAHVLNCAICGYCRPDPASSVTIPVVGRDASSDERAESDETPPRRAVAAIAPKRGLGDLVERAVKPIAVALKSDCLDEHHNLKPDSGCAKRRDSLNRFGAGVASAVHSRSEVPS